MGPKQSLVGSRTHANLPRLEGVIVTGGHNTMNTTEQCGGGMYNLMEGGLSVNNVEFVGNSSKHRGGGLCNYHGGRMALPNVTFTNNAAVAVNTDADNKPHIVNGTVNMGAYEVQ